MKTTIIRALAEPHLRIPIKEHARLILRHTQFQKKLVFTLLALLLTNTALELVNPQILRYFIDEAFSGSPIRELIFTAVLFTAVAVAHHFINTMVVYVGGQVAWTATNTLREELTRHCLYLDMPFHTKHTPGELIERIDGDSSALGRYFSNFAINILGNALMLLGILILLYREDWRVGVPLTVFVLFASLILMRLRNVTIAHWKAEREATTQVHGFIEERLTAGEIIRTSGAREYTLKSYHELMQHWFRKGIKARILVSLIANGSRIMFDGGRFLGLMIGIYLFTNDLITIGTVFLIFHYGSMLQRPVSGFAGELEGLQQAGGSIVRILELLNTKATVIDGSGFEPEQDQMSVVFDDVSFAYDGSSSVLRNVSFEILPGESLGVVGRTGSGKTTIARLLFRLYDPDQGKIMMAGHNIREARVAQLREQVTYITQEVRLFQGSVRDNLTLFNSSISDERLLEIIEYLGLINWYRSLPDGLDTILQSDGGGLSSGEAQLLAFARAFLKDPGVLILDESTSYLDRETETFINQVVAKLITGRTAIIIAHHLLAVQGCNNIMILENGKIVEYGRREHLAADPDTFYSRLLQTDLGVAK